MSAGATLLLLSALWLGLLVAVAEGVERSARLGRLARHPVSFALALGVYATSWTFYGSLDFASRYGYSFLAIYLGMALSCLAIPTLWGPLARVVRRNRLTSAADLLALRFDSRAMGVVVTVFLTAGLMPYVALQLRGTADAAAWLAGPEAGGGLSALLAALICAFAGGVGARYAEPWTRRPGLLATLAVESLLKVSALLVVGWAMARAAFPEGVGAALSADPSRIEALYAPTRGPSWPALLLLSFFAAFLLPRQFHLAFVERPSRRALRHAIWAVPLLMLLLNLPQPLMYLAGPELAPPGTPPGLYALSSGVAWVDTLVFLGGLSAASAMVVVSGVALSGMALTHLWLPLLGPERLSYARLAFARRASIVGMAALGFALHGLLPRGGALVDLGLVSFTAVLQLAPGVLAALFWPRATARGVGLGLLGGVVTWGVVAATPLLGLGAGAEQTTEALGFGADPRSATVWLSLLANVGLLVAGSLSRPPTHGERAGALSCAPSPTVAAAKPVDIELTEKRLAQALGEEVAAGELQRARAALGVGPDEQRPLVLRALATRLEQNLSELLGPVAARSLVEGDADEVDLAAQLEAFREAPSLAPEAELIRRYLLGALSELPLGLAVLDREGRVILWNAEAARLSGLESIVVLGLEAAALPAPWGELLIEGRAARELERAVQGERVLRVAAARVAGGEAGEVVLIEELTERRRLRRQVDHQDRLASLGRLAAGVSHEVLNPLTGLLMVARNLAAEEEPEDLEERLGLIVHEGQRIEAIVRGMLTFARGEGVDEAAAVVPVAEVAQEALRLTRLGERARGLRWTLDLPEGLAARASRRALGQVLVNLLGNARDASPPGAEVRLRATIDDDSVLIEVSDDGPGVPSELEAQLFEPFFTTKGPGEGTGLGLAVSRRLVEGMGGEIRYHRAPRTTFSVRLPRASDEEEHGSHPGG